MLTGIVKSAFHASHVDGYEPSEVVQRVSTGLTAFSAERFVTMVAAIVAPVERRLTYVNAGHPAAALWSPSRDPLWLESTGPLVSPALAGSKWDTQVVPIEDGYQLLLYTDGVSDVLAGSEGGSERRFHSLMARVPGGGTPLLDAIVADVHHELVERPQPDDITLVTAKVLPSTCELSA
jgi:sigma-B regulation protein RsbU (phosphoserine phosphatase)